MADIRTQEKTFRRIKEDILDELAKDPRIDETQINVKVNNNAVILEGNVPSYSARISAEKSAWIVSGGMPVDNRLDIRG